MKWFEGKKASNDLANAGYRSTINENELYYVDYESSMNRLLAKERSRKGYGGERGEDGMTDADG